MAKEIKLTEQENAIRNLGFALKEMSQTKGWLEGILPHLKNLTMHSWLDPQLAKDDQDFMYKYAVSWAKAKAADEIQSWVDNMISQAERIQKKLDGEIVDDFVIE